MSEHDKRIHDAELLEAVFESAKAAVLQWQSNPRQQAKGGQTMRGLIIETAEQGIAEGLNQIIEYWQERDDD